MPYEALAMQPKSRAEADLVPGRYDERAPGLYPGEMALELDDGTFIAASVDQTWLANGAGVSFKACARWIDADGATHLCPQGQHVETLTCQVATVEEVEAWGFDALALEALLLALGEPPRLLKDVPVDDGPNEQRPVFDLPDDARASVDIRKAVAIVGATRAQADVGALLALSREAVGAASGVDAKVSTSG